MTISTETLLGTMKLREAYPKVNNNFDNVVAEINNDKAELHAHKDTDSVAHPASKISNDSTKVGGTKVSNALDALKDEVDAISVNSNAAIGTFSMDATGTDTITASFIGVTYFENLKVNLKSAGTNTTTTPTININGLGAVNIKIELSDGTKIDPPVGSLPSQATFRYDLTDFILTNPDPNAWQNINLVQQGFDNYGATDISTKLNVLISTIGSDDATVKLPKGMYKVSSNVTQPSNVYFYFEHGAIFDIDNGIELELNGGMNSDVLSNRFMGDGNVVGSPKISEVYTEWFGAIGDGIVDDTINFAKPFIFSKPVKLMSGKSYLITDTLSLPDMYEMISDVDPTTNINASKYSVIKFRPTIKNTPLIYKYGLSVPFQSFVGGFKHTNIYFDMSGNNKGGLFFGSPFPSSISTIPTSANFTSWEGVTESSLQRYVFGVTFDNCLFNGYVENTPAEYSQILLTRIKCFESKVSNCKFIGGDVQHIKFGCDNPVDKQNNYRIANIGVIHKGSGTFVVKYSEKDSWFNDFTEAHLIHSSSTNLTSEISGNRFEHKRNTSEVYNCTLNIVGSDYEVVCGETIYNRFSGGYTPYLLTSTKFGTFPIFLYEYSGKIYIDNSKVYLEDGESFTLTRMFEVGVILNGGIASLSNNSYDTEYAIICNQGSNLFYSFKIFGEQSNLGYVYACGNSLVGNIYSRPYVQLIGSSLKPYNYSSYITTHSNENDEYSRSSDMEVFDNGNGFGSDSIRVSNKDYLAGVFGFERFSGIYLELRPFIYGKLTRYQQIQYALRFMSTPSTYDSATQSFKLRFCVYNPDLESGQKIIAYITNPGTVLYSYQNLVGNIFHVYEIIFKSDNLGYAIDYRPILRFLCQDTTVSGRYVENYIGILWSNLEVVDD